MKERSGIVGDGRGEPVSPLLRAGVGGPPRHHLTSARPSRLSLQETVQAQNLSSAFYGITRQDKVYAVFAIAVKLFLLDVDILNQQREDMARRSAQTPISEDVRIGSRIKEVRIDRGIQQKGLAAQLGMEQSALSRYERGEMRLPSSLLARIARALKVSSDEILGLKEMKRGAVVRDQRFLKRLQAIDSLPERQKDALLTTIDGLLRTSRAS